MNILLAGGSCSLVDSLILKIRKKDIESIY